LAVGGASSPRGASPAGDRLESLGCEATGVSRRFAELDLPRGAEKRHAVEAIFDRIAPRYDVLNDVITLGTHRRWKRAAIEALGMAPGSRVLDLGCGTGDLLFELGRKGVRGIGVDISAGMLSAARRRGAPGTLTRASADALPFPSTSCDGLACGFALRNFVSIEQVLTETARVLRPGARVAFVEVDRPRMPLLAALHRVWFERGVPLVGRLANDAAAYRWLPASARYLPDEAALRRLFERAGFTDLHKRSFLLGAAQLLTARRSEPPC
jgi:demethylmenaquinone methyltransferase/2-methoxy-6-polyprenyl-1,4-benzoquinol methylase